MQHHLSYYSLTPEMNSFSQNPRVPAVQEGQRNAIRSVPGVRVHCFFASGYLSIPFRLQSMAPLKEGDQWQMWEFIPI